MDPPELRAARCAMFEQCVVELVRVLVVLMRYPEDVEQMSEDEVRGGNRMGRDGMGWDGMGWNGMGRGGMGWGGVGWNGRQ